MRGSPRPTTAEGPVWGKPHTYVPPTDCLRGCGDGAELPEPPSQHPARMRDSPRATTVEVRCGASPTPTRRRRIACAVAATVPTGRNHPRNIPRGGGACPPRPPWKSGVGQAPHLRAAEGLPARLRRRCRAAGTALATSRMDAGLAPRDHRGRPVWGKPHTYVAPTDCLHGCGDGADRPESSSQYPAGMRDSPRTTTVEILCGASPTPTCRQRIACAVAATMPSCRNRPRNIPRGGGTRPARPRCKARCGASPIPTRRRAIACAVAATMPTGLNGLHNIACRCGACPA